MTFNVNFYVSIDKIYLQEREKWIFSKIMLEFWFLFSSWVLMVYNEDIYDINVILSLTLDDIYSLERQFNIFNFYVSILVTMSYALCISSMAC